MDESCVHSRHLHAYSYQSIALLGDDMYSESHHHGTIPRVHSSILWERASNFTRLKYSFQHIQMPEESFGQEIPLPAELSINRAWYSAGLYRAANASPGVINTDVNCFPGGTMHHMSRQVRTSHAHTQHS